MPFTETYLLDTNIISSLMQDRVGTNTARIRERLQRAPDSTLVTSVVVQCELLFGMARWPSQRLQKAYDLQMEQLTVLPLVTTNLEFTRVPGLKVENWLQPL